MNPPAAYRAAPVPSVPTSPSSAAARHGHRRHPATNAAAANAGAGTEHVALCALRILRRLLNARHPLVPALLLLGLCHAGGSLRTTYRPTLDRR